MDDEMVIPLGKLKNLVSLHIERSQMTNKGLGRMIEGSTSSLQHFRLIEAEEVSDEGISDLLSVGKFTQFHLEALPLVGDETILRLSESQRSLQSLAVNQCGEINQLTLSVLAGKSLKLERLSLTGIASLSVEVIELFTKNNKAIEELNLSWCRSVNDAFVEAMLMNLKKLKKVTLWGCHRVTEVGVGKLLTNQVQVVGKDQFSNAILD